MKFKGPSMHRAEVPEVGGDLKKQPKATERGSTNQRCDEGRTPNGLQSAGEIEPSRLNHESFIRDFDRLPRGGKGNVEGLVTSREQSSA